MTSINGAHLRASFVSAAGIAVLLSGCGTIKDMYMVDSVTRENRSHEIHGLTGPTGQFIPRAFNLDCDTFAEDGAPSSSDEVCSDRAKTAYVEASSDADKRNRLMYVLLKNSDGLCEAHKAAILGDAAAVNYSLTQLSNTLSTLGAVVTGSTTVRVLSGAASYVSGTGTNVTANFYQNLLAPAVIKAINTERDRLRADMDKHRTDDIKTYPVDKMLYDLERFHSACSFYNGIILLTKAGDQPVTSKPGDAANPPVGDNHAANQTTNPPAHPKRDHGHGAH